MPEQLLGNQTGSVTADQQNSEDEFYNALTGALGEQGRRIATAQLTGQVDDTGFWTNERKITAAFLLAWLLKIAEQGIASTVTQTMTPAAMGVSDAVNARATAWAEKHALELARGLTATTKEIAKRQIAGWLAAGGRDIGTLSQLLGETIAPQWRAEMIAQTEVTKAWSVALQEIAAEYPQIVSFQWQTQEDERVCPVCGYLHGKRRTKDGLYLGSVSPPPAHPRCRCGELLVITVEAKL